MEILDIDIQMVRDALKDAPEFAKGLRLQQLGFQSPYHV